MKAATVSGPSAWIRRSSSAAQRCEKSSSLSPCLGELPVVRAHRVPDLRQRQVERLVEHRQAGQAAGHQARAVIAALARDDLLLLGPAEHVVVVPDQLDLGLVGVRAGQAVVDPPHALGRQVDDPLRELDRRLRGMPDIGVVIGELPHLPVDRVGDLLAAVADVDAVQPGERVEALAAVAVDDADALAAAHDPAGRRPMGVVLEVRRGVQDVRPVQSLQILDVGLQGEVAFHRNVLLSRLRRLRRSRCRRTSAR